MRGALAIVTTVRWDAMDADAATDERGTGVRRNRLGPTPRCRREVQRQPTLPEGDGVTKSRVIRTISYKPQSRCVREAGVFTAEPVCCVGSISICNTPARPRVQRALGLPRALFVSRANDMQNFGRYTPRERSSSSRPSPGTTDQRTNIVN